MSNDFAKKVFKQGGPPPHGFKVSLSEDIVKDPETQKPVKIYYLLFKNSEFQALKRNQLVDVSVWLKQTHDAMRSVGLRALIQPIFDGYEGLTPDNLQYKLQELRKKRQCIM